MKFLQEDSISMKKQLMALALLPPTSMPKGFEIVKNFASEKILVHGEKHNCAKDIFTSLSTQIRALLKYFDNYWMTKWPLEQVSCYGREDRTDNISESRHSLYKYDFRRNPPPSIFIRKCSHNQLILILILII